MFGTFNSYCGGQGAGSFGAQGFGQAAGFYGSQPYGQTAGYGAAPTYVQTAGYAAAAPAYAQTAGYGAAPTYVQTAGYAAAAPAYAQTAGYGAASAAAPVSVQVSGYQAAGDFSFGQGRMSASNQEQNQLSISSSSSSPLGADLQTNTVSGVVTGGSSEGSVTTGTRRQGRVRQQVIRLPEQPQGPARQVRQRLPTPEPDTIEKVYLQRAAAEIIEEIVEVPSTPPPRIQEKHVVEPAGPPQIVKRVVRVPPRSGGGNTVIPQQPNLGAAANMTQFNSNAQPVFGSAAGTGNFGSFGGFGSAQGGFQQGFGGFGSAPGGFQQGFGGFGSAPGGFQQGFSGFSSMAAGSVNIIPENFCFAT